MTSHRSLRPWGLFLTLVFALLVWGPPRIRFESPEADVGSIAEDLAFEGAFSFDAANLLHLAVWFVAGTIVYFAFMYRPHGYLRQLARPPALWYSLFGLWAVASTAYSPSAMYTLFFAAKILIMLLFTLLLARVAGRLWPLAVVFGVYSLQWVAIAVLFVLRPDWVGISTHLFGYRLHGGILADYGASAATTGVLAISMLLFRSERIRRKTQALLALVYALSWVFIVLSQTRSTILSSAAALALLLALQHRASLRLIAVAIGVFALATTVLTGFDREVQRFLVRGQTVEQLQSLSNRSVAFEHLVSHWKYSPIIGYGYAAGSRALMAGFVRETGMAMGSAHDALSRVLSDLGAVGGILLAASLLSSAKLLRILWQRTSRGSRARYLLALVAALLVQQIVGSVFSGGIAAGSAVYGIVVATLALLLSSTTASCIETASLGYPGRSIHTAPSTRLRGT